MAIAYVQEIGKNTKTAAGTTLAITTTATANAGNLIVMRVVGDSGRIVSSISDSRGNTWAVDFSHATGPKPNICSTLQDGGALQSGDTVTITFNVSCGQAAAILDEFSGIAASPLDKTASATATLVSRDAGTTATLAQADELVVGCFALGAAENLWLKGAAYTDFTTPFLVATGTSIEGEYAIVAATTAVNPIATGRSQSSNGCTATYKGTAAAAVTTPPRQIISVM